MDTMDVDEFETVEIVISPQNSPQKSRQWSRKGPSRRKKLFRPKQRGLYQPKVKRSPKSLSPKSQHSPPKNHPTSTVDETSPSASSADIGNKGSLAESTVALNRSDSQSFITIDEDGPEHSYARTPEPQDSRADTAPGWDAALVSQSSPTENSSVAGLSSCHGERGPNIQNDAPVCPPTASISEALELLLALLPDDWIVLADAKGFHFLQLSPTSTKAIQREIYLMYNGPVKVVVHCVTLPDSNEITKLASDPVMFKDEDYQAFCQKGLILCWGMLQFQACAGADFKEAKNLWSDMPDTYVDLNPYLESTFETSCRSNNCQRIIPLRFNSYRCPECSKVLKTLKERNKSAKNENISEDTPNKNLTNEQVRAKLENVTRKFRKTEKRASYLQSKIEKLEALLEKEGVDLEEEESKFFANILERSQLSEMQQIFLEQQFKYATASNPKAHRWHPAMIRLAIKIKSHSTAAYEALRDSGAVSLPHSRTLFDYTHYVKEQVGVNKDLMKMLVEEINKQDDPKNQYHALIFDEMYISQNLIYRKADGALMGYAYLDDVDKEIQQFDAFLDGKTVMGELPLASTMLAFMVKGLTANVKSVVASYPCRDLNKNMISARVWEVISECEGARVKILSVVCDGSPNNRAFFKLHTPITPINETDTGIVFDTLNIFSEDERPLFFIADVAHLLKTIRNCLYNSREEGGRFRCMQINGEKLLWKTIVRLYYMYRGDTLRECWKLTSQNVFPNSYSTMRVKYAAQVLSQTVANALKKLNWPGTKELILFLEKMNKFFDILNGAHSSQCIKQLKPDLAPYSSGDDPRFEWLLKDFWKEYIMKWKRDNERLLCKLPQKDLAKTMLAHQTIEGIEISIRGFIAATKLLLDPRKGKARFVMARAFSQDPLEQHFSQQRGVLGGSTNPNTQQFLRTQVSIALQGKLKTRRQKANVEDDMTPSQVSSEPMPKLKRRKDRNQCT